MQRIAPLARSKLTDGQHTTWQALTKMVADGFVPSRFEKTLDALYASPRPRKLDYISCNIYEPFGPVKGVGRPNGLVRWWDYAADTQIYGTYTRAYRDGNPELPVYMGENGLMFRQPIGQKAEPRPDGWNRERYFKAYFMEVIRCMKEGVPIRGYLFWSILDDFEWDNGYAPRCGAETRSRSRAPSRGATAWGRNSDRASGSRLLRAVSFGPRHVALRHDGEGAIAVAR